MGRKPIVGIFSVGVEEPYRWEGQRAERGGDSLVGWPMAWPNDLRPWFTKFSGVLHDERWLKPVEDLYRRYARWETYLRNERPLARVGLVYSQQTAWFHGTRVEDHTAGWYQALIEARNPFEMVHDGCSMLRTSTVQNAHPANIAALSDTQCRQLRDFVVRGGSLIATHETSLYDEWGVRRKRLRAG